MSFFKKIGRGFKEAFEKIGDGVDKAVDKVSDVAEKVVDIAGDVTEGVTRAVAGDKVADKVKSTFDNVEHAVGRTVHGIASVIATPLAALDDMAQNGFIDGLTKHVVDGSQDVMGATARLLGGEKAEKKFDKVFDEKIQSYIETGLSTAIRVGLIFFPGGQAVLLGDAISEAGSLAYRAANDEKLGVMDYVGVGMAFMPVGGAGVAGTKGAVSAGTKATVTATKHFDDVAKAAIAGSDDLAKPIVNGSTQTASITAKNTAKSAVDDVGATAVKSGEDISLLTKGEISKQIVMESGSAMVEQAATDAVTKIVTKQLQSPDTTQSSTTHQPNSPSQPIQTEDFWGDSYAKSLNGNNNSFSPINWGF